jgi:hypothetical protein
MPRMTRCSRRPFQVQRFSICQPCRLLCGNTTTRAMPDPGRPSIAGVTVCPHGVFEHIPIGMGHGRRHSPRPLNPRYPVVADDILSDAMRCERQDGTFPSVTGAKSLIGCDFGANASGFPGHFFASSIAQALCAPLGAVAAAIGFGQWLALRPQPSPCYP